MSAPDATPAVPARRSPDGYMPIEGYGVLGDGRTVALVAADGRIDWWPFPTLDAPPILAAVLDPDRGGYFSLAPVGPLHEVRRRYVEGTNVIETVLTTPTGSVRVTDALNVGSAGRLPWTELARRIEGLAGSVTLAWELRPGDRFGRDQPRVTSRAGTCLVTVQDQTIAVVTGGIPPGKPTADGIAGEAVISEGHRGVLALVGTDHEPVFLPDPDAVDTRLERTVASWRRWSRLVGDDGPWNEAVHRSALALKTLLAESTGAIAAAATTSLPEAVGGPKNWDYRYSWVRDSSFALDALINLGLHEEVHGAVSWLLQAIRANGGDLHVFYSLDGSVADDEQELDLPGYRHSRPVRSGNSAASQLQLGAYGDLMDTLYRYTQEGHVLDEDTAGMLAALVDRCGEQWMRADSGIWELGKVEHYTISKIGCWVAFDRAWRLAEAGQLPEGKVAGWKQQADEVRAWVDEHCWSPAKGTYTFYAGTEDLDAAVLLAARTGFASGERLEGTIDAVTAELGELPLVYRYTGMREEEGAFVACTFWLVEALVHAGRLDEARTLMDRAVARANDLGLLSEEIDPATGAFLGNLPQGLSHLSLINAAFAFHQAGGPPAGTKEI